MTRNATAAEDAVARLSAVFPRENNQAYEAPVAFACSCFKRIRKERFSGVIAIWFFARQPPNCSVERGFLTFYRFLQLAEGQFALRVGHVPDRSGSLADFFFIVIPFPLHNPHRANTHRIFDKTKRVKPAPVSQI